MTRKTTDGERPETTWSLPSCCREMAEKMAGCGPMIEEMMSRFTAESKDAGCREGEESGEKR